MVAANILRVHGQHEHTLFGISALELHRPDFKDLGGSGHADPVRVEVEVKMGRIVQLPTDRQLHDAGILAVPQEGLHHPVAGADRVRPATPADVPGMAALEMEVSGITREEDYSYCIANPPGFWHAAVYENARGDIDGFMISSAHPAMNMLGPCVARSDAEAAALILRELDVHRGRSPVFLLPVDRPGLVRQLYDWGARNCELHFCQVRGEFQPFRGVNMPTFLPETG